MDSTTVMIRLFKMRQQTYMIFLQKKTIWSKNDSFVHHGIEKPIRIGN